MTVIPVNSTGTNGDPGGAAGMTGWTCAATLTFTAQVRACGSGSMTSITHSGSPEALSFDWTNFSPVEASKFRTGSNAPAAYAPDGNTAPNSTGIGP